MASSFVYVTLMTAVITAIEAWTLSNILSNLISDVIPKKANVLQDPVVHMSTDEIIAYFGYPVESHYVKTKDGYILKIFRIPYGRKKSTGSRPPVIIQHGILSSSDVWVANFPHQSLGFAAADAGYDVWIGNIRGNTYGANHTTLSPENDMFWKFSFDQMGEFDMPAMIDYILDKTRYKQLYIVAHSMGTSMTFAMLCTQPEYNDKVKRFIAIAPAVFMSHSKTPIVLLAPLADEIAAITNILGAGKFKMDPAVRQALGAACVATISQVCETSIFLIGGFNYKEFNESRINVYLAHFPSETSVWAVAHFAQQYKNKRFCKCNWGREENWRRYNQESPPDYDLTKITTPTALFWAANDIITSPRDTELIVPHLKNFLGSYQIGDTDWIHTDFMWAINSNTVLFPTLFSLLPKFDQVGKDDIST